MPAKIEFAVFDSLRKDVDYSKFVASDRTSIGFIENVFVDADLCEDILSEYVENSRVDYCKIGSGGNGVDWYGVNLLSKEAASDLIKGITSFLDVSISLRCELEYETVMVRKELVPLLLLLVSAERDEHSVVLYGL